MARVLISVRDPLGVEKPNRPRMILGAYVELAVEGRKISDVIPVSRENLHEGNIVWVAGDNGRLDVREVEIIWAGKESVFVGSGLAPGEKLITSDIPAPVDGQELRIVGKGSIAESSDNTPPRPRTYSREKGKADR
jgi:hypothetical protein